MLSCFCHIRLFATPQTAAHQASLSMGFTRQEYWSGLPFPSPGDLPDPGIEPASLLSPILAGGFFTTSTTWKALLIQWLRIHLTMQETWVQSLVWEDPTCCRATKPKSHNYWACAPEPRNCNYRAHMQQLLEPSLPTDHAPQQEKPPQWKAHAPQLESSPSSL